MVVFAPPPGPARERDRPHAVWLGAGGGGELEFVRRALGGLVEIVAYGSVDEAVADADRGPRFVIFAADRPGRWSQAEITAAFRHWPLATIVGVVTSLADGRRRSGPIVSGVEEVAWHDLPGRIACWLDDLSAGRRGALGIPPTARREERLLDALDAVVASVQPGAGAAVSLAGGRGADLEGVAELLSLVGRRIAGVTAGRPGLDTATPLLVWDAMALGADDLAWLRMLSANRPDLGIVIVESFPRGDSTQAALRAGAGAVLGRPLMLETLEGTLRWMECPSRAAGRRGTGLGRAAGRR